MRDSVILKFIKKIRKVRNKIRTIYLFGSRARRTPRPDSDYDLLLVVDESFTLSDKSKLYDAVMDVLLETGRLISLKIFKKQVFNRLKKMGTPFTQNILREGIKIG